MGRKARKRAEATEEGKRIREGQKKRAFEEQTSNNTLVKYVQRQIPGDATYEGIPSKSPVADRSSRGDSDGTPPLDAEPEVTVTTKEDAHSQAKARELQRWASEGEFSGCAAYTYTYV
jgi:hypothetical protein